MFRKITQSVYLVGGSGISADADCMVYALDLGELVLIDCGAGKGWARIRDNIHEAGFDPDTIHTLVLTHAHVDHIGAAHVVKEQSGCRIVAHILDADAIRTGDSVLTASGWYGISLPGVGIDRLMEGETDTLEFSKCNLELVHTPGHTPGSIVALLEDDDETVLFGQDIHGPFSDEFGSDIRKWKDSMQKLMELEADVLCEGHYGVFRPGESVMNFIENHLRANA